MRRTWLLGSVLLVLSILALSPNQASAQSPVVSGGTRLSVSRASDPAPVTTTTMTSAASVGYWNMIALANARISAWSFAPARRASYARTGAVRRGANP